MSRADSSYDGVWEESGSDELVLEHLLKNKSAQSENQCCDCNCVTFKTFASHLCAFTFGILAVAGYMTSYHGQLGYPLVHEQNVNQAEKHQHSKTHRFVETDRVNDKGRNWLNDKINNKSLIIEDVEVMTTITGSDAVIQPGASEENSDKSEENGSRIDELATASVELIAPSAAQEPSAMEEPTAAQEPSAIEEPTAAQEPTPQP